MRFAQGWKMPLLVGGLAGGLTVGSVAQSPTGVRGGNLPDAQVEANVLRQLASATELSNQNIQSTTVYGTVTLTGNVHDEAMRTKAENLAARAQGVKKVVDQLTLGDMPALTADQSSSEQYAQYGAASQGSVSPPPDGGYTPAGPDNGNQGTGLSAGQQYPAQPGQYPVQPGYPGAPEYGNNVPAQPNYGGQPEYSNQGYQGQQPGYAGQPYPSQPGYPAQPGYPSQPGYSNPQAYGNIPLSSPTAGYPPQGRQPMYQNGYAPYPQGGSQGGQVGGQMVTVPAGSILQVRVDRGFDANHVAPGTPFSGVVMRDVVADGAVAIPRGAAVQGTVIDSKKAGVLKGEAQLALQVNGLSLGGQAYSLNTDVWNREGRDKTVSTVNSAVGLGAFGAILGGIAGGGSGAAIGAVAGGAAGVAGSAAAPGGRVIVPAEAVLTFRMAAPTMVTTVGQAELARLSYAAGPAQRPLPARRYSGPYSYGPGYYR